jgi:hypothetical protein
MQLKIQRSQRRRGVYKTVYFCLDVRADYTPEERGNIRRYHLGSQRIYNSRAARRHLDNAGAQLERTQAGPLADRFAGLARGAYAMVRANLALNISIDSIGRGHHIECNDLEELLEAEGTVRDACKNVTRYLQIAETFDGSEVVIEYDKGEERVHIAQPAPQLLAASAANDEPGTMPAQARTVPAPPFDPTQFQPEFVVAMARELWADKRFRPVAYAAGGFVVLILIVHFFF